MWSASLAFIPLVFSWLASANRFFVSPVSPAARFFQLAMVSFLSGNGFAAFS